MRLDLPKEKRKLEAKSPVRDITSVPTNSDLQEFEKAKSDVKYYERILLPTLSIHVCCQCRADWHADFDLTVHLPYSYLVILKGRSRLFTKSLRVLNTMYGSLKLLSSSRI